MYDSGLVETLNFQKANESHSAHLVIGPQNRFRHSVYRSRDIRKAAHVQHVLLKTVAPTLPRIFRVEESVQNRRARDLNAVLKLFQS